MPLRYKPSKEAKRSTIAILIKLFAISIVARRRLGLSKSFLILSRLLWSFLFSETNWLRVKEKKATSLPEIIPEKIKRIIKDNIFRKGKSSELYKNIEMRKCSELKNQQFD